MTNDEQDDNYYLREEEVLAVESIYETAFSYNKSPEGIYSGSLSINVEVDCPVELKIAGEEQLSLQYLTPVSLNFTLPKEYPEAQPEYNLSCLWLTKEQLNTVSEQLDNIWEMERSVILFTFADYIQHNLLGLLDIQFPLFLEAETGRAVAEQLIRYDQERRNKDFFHGYYDCNICFEEKRGEYCVQLDQCRHVFCLNCLRGYFEMLIEEGMVMTVRCPHLDCRKSQHRLSEATLRRIVGSQFYERYDKLYNKQLLDADPNVIWCPRLDCQAPVRKESETEKLCICTKCGFAFCQYCNKTWHGSKVFCQVENSNRVVQEYMAATEYVKGIMEMRYGKKHLTSLIRNYLEHMETQKWLRSNAMPCPSCNTSIEKTHGCNHMKCVVCSSHFCYLCGSIIDKDNPYKHFNAQNSGCHMLLFEGVEIDEPLELDDFLFEEM
ncbi:RWD-domain-containing protein [Basidiobolus meristosporus CBS 931.73]|uniref:RBR-type E3 ubiquitin transferase n=1 Tax=Basidiobolus meristosporus CBS 931.73 TaxID=1314790 RepID=A0A1Y1YZ91_9FUNG|nr:RWD-domain-containing protein [Basidiobolus meristosporus CBS 931.73]|eukprot:ORY03007.1 RWD-domain-containing protein [Basidiobolus meristosporus CBS 931.73]